jgi:glycyl-tRNA synthetase beta chain
MNQNANNSLSFLLEIGTEDLPARFIPPAMRQLKENTERFLNENYLHFTEIKTYGTPRRLALIADGLPLMQRDRIREVFGPSKKAAFDANGRPTKAATGFAQSQGISVDSLVIKNKDKGEYVAAVIEEKGVHIREILPELLKKITLSIYFPKSMRWGDKNVRFPRPIRWLLALLDKEIISFDIEGIASSNLTRGHRFLSPASFQIKEIPGYRKLLGNNCVIVDPADRKRIIIEKTAHLLASFDEKPIHDEELLETVVNLVEYPVPVIASFSEEYLALPRELLITVMKGHQKYFAVEKPDGKISNRFVVISNTSEENTDTVKIGAERVIKARFEDARFYFEEDTKRPLSKRIEDLRKVAFQEGLGSIYDKTERLASLAGFLADKIMPSAKTNLIRAARLAKTDLITGVVREFPELQGIMGKYYALHDGEEKEVADALEEQYLPAHSSGILPRTDAGSLLSMADKIDNIAAFFSIGLIPTGSEDPFALRRQSLGIIAILLDKGYSMPLKEFVDKAVGTLSNVKYHETLKSKILQFFENRLETVFSDYGYSSDLVQSVLSLATDIELKKILARLDALMKGREEKGYDDFLSAIKRVNNILPKTVAPELKPEFLLEEPEQKLSEKIAAMKIELETLLREGKYQNAVSQLFSLTEPVNNFFDKVLVMDKREEIKLNRLALLSEVWKTVSEIADFSKLSASQ